MDGAVQEHLRHTDVQTTIYTKPKRLACLPAQFATTFTDHGMRVPPLLFLKVNKEVELETGLIFAKE